MPVTIDFPDTEPSYVFQRDCLAFSARMDGKPVECLITFELLLQRFGARGFAEAEAREAFRRHEDEIQDIARHHLEMSWISPEGRVLLTTRFTRLKVSYGPNLCQWAEGKALAEAAFRLLAEVIGPTGGEVSVEWERPSGPFDAPEILLRLADASGSVSAVFDPRELKSSSLLRIRLARLWGELLEIRSQKLILQFG